MFNANEHMLKLKGKDYLQVLWRLVWFREDHPDWCIETQLVEFNGSEKHAIFKATILDENGMQKSSGFGSESIRDFGDYIEKAETKAVGRALAMLGYGTQFAPDLEEGERIVDSPVDRTKEKEYKCVKCGKPFTEFEWKGRQYTAKEAYDLAFKRSGALRKHLCFDCLNAETEKEMVLPEEL